LVLALQVSILAVAYLLIELFVSRQEAGWEIPAEIQAPLRQLMVLTPVQCQRQRRCRK